ncbi:ATP synthase subunit I [Hazenella sp. IB182357]|uniref:ATP synthase subunit I n=1 Tax=Polycladospora coralii TaxID=2771432 RepID=A0A926N961_9BACL|nr:ATP synthase subunit I [Polycladospora coralii]MBD1372127.1 ATP synthase subunit I [Polycladospora coralii]MBS7530633.1 ATP synthase subunit I [Polycladospora coralii]
MKTPKPLLQTVILLTSVLIMFFMFMWFFTPYARFFAGLIVGMFVSIYNISLMGRRLQLIEEAISQNDGRRTPGTGFFNRLLMVTFAIIIAYKFPAHLDAIGVIIGLPVSYIIAIFVELHRIKKFREGGENEEWS